MHLVSGGLNCIAQTSSIFNELPRIDGYPSTFSNLLAALKNEINDLLFVDDLDALVAQIADRGLDPAARDTYANGVRKITYRDAMETRSGSAVLHGNLVMRCC